MNQTTADSVTFIVSPYHVGVRNHRVGDGPNRILQWNLVQQIGSLGVETHIVEIEPVDKFEGEIGRSFEVLRQTSKLVSVAHDRNSFPIILAGNCMASVGVVCGLGLKDCNFVVFDAHDDLNTPSTTKSGYLDGMGWSMLTGEIFQTLCKTIPGYDMVQGDIRGRLLYCGLRDVDDDERRTVQESDAAVVWGGVGKKIDFAGELEHHLTQKDWTSTLVHLDLDVLDESLGKVNVFSCPGGLTQEDLLHCMLVTAQKTTPVALTIASFDPNLGGGHAIARIAVTAIVRFIEALTEHGAIKVSK